ncbi:excalibur calcium-binding domain-containing protein [Mycobacteroides abscessus]|uniref:excalibur calcium-binding domain-containing protein n=1 Tax=Mycobacteroides abscessus TaxID=36809 RepID=UPI000C25C82A|nr:excalibur calcium-binding domain-containing protein [Mycobacteroides abscessus]
MKLTNYAIIGTLVTGVTFLAATPFAACAATPTQVDPPYANCKEAHADGAYNIRKGDPGYRAKLDRDGDGIACEG